MKLNRENTLYREDLSRCLQGLDPAALEGRTFLITGATGLLGTMLTDALLLLEGVKVIAVSRSRESVARRLGHHFGNPDFSVLEQDVCRPFPADLKVDYILPLASNTHPLAYSQFPVETIMTNIKGAENALELADRCGATVLYPSSVEIYGNARDGEAFTEEYTGKLDLSKARACYTESKRVSEAMCQSYIAERGVNCKIVRLSRIFGPTMLESDSKASSQFIKKALEGEDIVLKSEGKQFFSYTYVAEAINAMLWVLLRGENGVVYNVSSELSNMTLAQFAGCCAAIAGTSVVFDLPTETERKGYSVAATAILDNTRLKSLGWTPQLGFEDAISRTIACLK